MPPKGGGQEKAAAKALLEKKKKAVEDKTFGLKGKNKSKAVQQYVQTLTSQVQQNAANAKALRSDAQAKEERDKKKAADALAAKELAELFKVAIVQPKLDAGVDPKSVLCEYFRQGKCTKGFKCKYSHDPAVERKGAKIDLFADRREGGDDAPMEEWDQATLEAAIKQKHGAEAPAHRTDIICKHFLDAIEKKLYGWFWVCPNGGAECKYRHALPPGYVLKSQLAALMAEEKENHMSIEEEVEELRKTVDARTPVTDEVFHAWKKAKTEKRAAADAAREAERAKSDRLSGRMLFDQGLTGTYDEDGAAEGYAREYDDDDLEAAAHAQAASNLAAARARGAAALSGIGEEDQALFAGDDDDDDGSGEGPDFGEGPSGMGGGEGGGDDDDDDDDGSDELDDEQIAELEARLREAPAGSNGAGPSRPSKGKEKA